MGSAEQVEGETSNLAARGWGGRLLCGVVAALLLFSGLRSGAYFPEQYLLVGAVAAAACAVGVVLVGPRWRPSPEAATALAALVGLSAWTGLSASWSPDPAGADLATQRDLAYVAFFLLTTLAVGSGRHAAVLLRLVVGVLVVLCAVGLLSRLRPQLIHTDETLLVYAQGRLAHPLGYWNALGAVAAMAVAGALGLAADARESRVVRSLAAAGGALAVCTLYLTISRGADLALASALAVMLAVSPRRLRLAVSGFVVFAAGAVGAAIIHAHPALVAFPALEADQSREGGPVIVALLAVAAAAAAAQLALTRVTALNRSRSASFRRAPVPAMVFGVPAALVVLVFAGAYATSSDRLEGQAANGTVSVRSFFDRQYGDFMDTSKPPPAGQERLSTARSSRSAAYEVAIDGLQAHPLAGDGAAGYAVRWIRDRDTPEFFRNAHSLELETGSELGIVGLLLLAGLLVPLGAGMRGMRKARGGLTRSQAAAASGVVAVWMVHSALDWDWQMGAVTFPALACGAALLAQGRSSGRPRAAMFARFRMASATEGRPHA